MVHKIVIFYTTLTFINTILGETKVEEENECHYTNKWSILISRKDDSVLKKSEMLEKFEIMPQDDIIPGSYIVTYRGQLQNEKYENRNVTDVLYSYNGVLWAQQMAMIRTTDNGLLCCIFSLIGMCIDGCNKARYKKKEERNKQLASHAGINRSASLIQKESTYKNLVNDPFFKEQYYLHDYRKNKHEIRRDINVVRVWMEEKNFGSGIRIAVVDAGIQSYNPDLQINYDSNYSNNFVSRIESKNLPAHGTWIASLIAMQINNSINGVGIAPLATIADIQVKNAQGSVTERDTLTAKGLLFKYEHIDISNNSWRPERYKNTMFNRNDYIRTITAIKRGITEGRQSKGIIYNFACGNGKGEREVCSFNILVNLLYTITVAGVKYNGRPTSYSTKCSSILVAAYSDNIVPENVSKKLVLKHTSLMGTSFATAIVSGIVALILEANSELTWREVQHVLVWTSQVAPMTAKYEEWFRNKAGFYFSQDFGFGLVDAYSAVIFAKSMQHIPPMNSCIVPINVTNEMSLNDYSYLTITFSTNACQNLPSEVNFIEHIQLLVNVEYPDRGAINILLKSPSGTPSFLLETSDEKNRFVVNGEWIIDTVHLWGESPRGRWTLRFNDDYHYFNKNKQGYMAKLLLLIHGTKDEPPHYNRKRKYKRFGPKP